MVLEDRGVAYMQASSALSIVGSFFVMLAIYRIDGYNKVFLKSVFYIALSDFFASIATVIGGTRSKSAACYFQGIVSNYFELTSFFWTFVVAYQVWLIVFRSSADKNFVRQQLLCWVPPLIFSLIPLSNSSYTNDDVTSGWCFISNNNDKYAILWFLVSFFLWLWLAFIAIVFIVIAVTYRLFYLSKNHAAKPVVGRLIGFPIILFISWVIPSVVDMNAAAGNGLRGNEEFVLISAYVLPTIQGLLNAFYFFGMNPHYFRAIFCTKAEKENEVAVKMKDAMNNSEFDDDFTENSDRSSLGDPILSSYVTSSVSRIDGISESASKDSKLSSSTASDNRSYRHIDSRSSSTSITTASNQSNHSHLLSSMHAGQRSQGKSVASLNSDSNSQQRGESIIVELSRSIVQDPKDKELFDDMEAVHPNNS